MAPLEPWEKVLVDYEAFAETTHGKQSCETCHGGSQDPDKEIAHEGLVANPSEDAQTYCAACHTDQVDVYSSSLHATQQGYWTVINARADPANTEAHAALETMFGNHCATCHTSCGECHVSQPDNVGGGLFNGHVFEKTPPMSRSCTACHGSRVGNEYMGKNEEYPGDVHFREARMNCVNCHSGDDLHGSGEVVEHRYAGAQQPLCTTCHTDVTSPDTDNLFHKQHAEQLQCQVCHSITYTSCDGCHVAVSEKSGKPFFETEATYFTFLIGLNPRQDEYRPYQYVLLRHVPVSPDSYEYYGEDLLPNFNALPTWVYTTPHNIQLKTPQTESCQACHGNADLFLTADKVAEGELEANQSVIVPEVPNPMP